MKPWSKAGVILFGAGVLIAAVATTSLKATPRHAERPGPRTILPADSPQTEVHVNKEYDDQGNLIRYDSSYTIIANNMEGDTAGWDSLMQSFGLAEPDSFRTDPSDPFGGIQEMMDRLHREMSRQDGWFQRFNNEVDSLFAPLFNGGVPAPLLEQPAAPDLPADSLMERTSPEPGTPPGIGPTQTL